MKITFKKHCHIMEMSFHRFGPLVRDLGDWVFLIWKFEIVVWFRKPDYLSKFHSMECISCKELK